MGLQQWTEMLELGFANSGYFEQMLIRAKEVRGATFPRIPCCGSRGTQPLRLDGE
jgi:hypothetical protein